MDFHPLNPLTFYLSCNFHFNTYAVAVARTNRNILSIWPIRAPAFITIYILVKRQSV